MKQNYTSNLCYSICFGILLAIFPMKNNSAAVNPSTEHKSIEKMEKQLLAEDQEVLHSELLFR